MALLVNTLVHDLTVDACIIGPAHTRVVDQGSRAKVVSRETRFAARTRVLRQAVVSEVLTLGPRVAASANAAIASHEVDAVCVQRTGFRGALVDVVLTRVPGKPLRANTAVSVVPVRAVASVLAGIGSAFVYVSAAVGAGPTVVAVAVKPAIRVHASSVVTPTRYEGAFVDVVVAKGAVKPRRALALVTI